MMNIPRPARAIIYRVATALVPLLILYGVLSEQDAAVWIGVLGAILDGGTSLLAARNTPRGPEPTPGDEPDADKGAVNLMTVLVVLGIIVLGILVIKWVDISIR